MSVQGLCFCCLLPLLALGATAAELPISAIENSAPLVTAMPLPTVDVELNGRPVSAEIESPDNPLVILATSRGEILVELFPLDAPQTVANFLGLAEGTRPFIDPVTASETQRPFYDGLSFHRVVAGFMVQAGSPTGASDGGPGYTIPDEINALSLGLDKMPVLDANGHPNPVLGIRSREDFQQRVLLPLYDSMGISDQATLEARVDEVDQRLHAMSVKQSLELLGYSYTETVQSRAPLRGAVAMANSGPHSNGSQFFINLADTDWLTGRHTVFGKVRAGFEVLDAIARVRVDADSRPLQQVTILSLRRLQRAAVSAPAGFE